MDKSKHVFNTLILLIFSSPAHTRTTRKKKKRDEMDECIEEIVSSLCVVSVVQSSQCMLH